MPALNDPARMKARLLARGGRNLRPAGLSRLLHDMERRTRQAPETVIETTTRALALAARVEDSEARARLHRARAHALRAASRYPEALQDYRTSLQLFRRLGNPDEVAVSRIGLVDTFMYLGKYRDAEREARAALKRFEATGDRVRQARMETNLGNIYHRQDAHAQALAFYDRAGRVFRRARDGSALALVQFNRGNVLSSMGRLDEARRAYLAARRVFHAQSLSARTDQVDYNLSYLHFLDNRLPQALEALEVVRPRFEKRGDRRHGALCRLDEAEILLRLNLWADAAIVAEEARDAFEKLGMKYETAKASAFLGAAAYRHGDLERAGKEFKRARQVFDREKNRLWAAETTLNQARVDIDRGRWPRARARAVEARALFRNAPWSDGAGRAWLMEAIAQRGLNRRVRAETCLRQALGEARRRRSPWLSADALELAGLLAAERGDRARARRRFRAAIAEVEKLRALLVGDDYRAAFFRNRDRAYLALAGLELEAGRPREAFRIVERGRARALLDLLVAPSLRGPARRPGLARLERQAEALLVRLDRHFHQSAVQDERGQRGAVPAVDETGQSWAVLESQATRLLSRLGGRHGAHAVLPDLEVRSVQDILERDEALIAYFEVGGRLGAFRITGSSFDTVTDLADAEEVARLAGRLRFQWGRFRLDPALVARHASKLDHMARADLGRLHELLLRPLDPGPDVRRLVIVPTGALRAVPFGALYDGARYLTAERAISVCPSAAVFQACRRTLPARGSRVLLAGLADELAPQVAEEIRDLERLFPGAAVLTGEGATVEAFRQEIRSASIIHVATHGVFHSERPNLSGLRLHDRWLYGYDVARLRLAPGLVTLSACSTGRSAAWGGGEWMGLARSFLSAGSRQILVGLWDVDDAATRSLMRGFYASLVEGSRPAEALARTQAGLASAGVHPYYWSGFSLVGDV